ncbi:hypothetical protein SERLA73DRAFT_118377, partial [Serpula lacrymans var. lacrymans S7.3]
LLLDHCALWTLTGKVLTASRQCGPTRDIEDTGLYPWVSWENLQQQASEVTS